MPHPGSLRAVGHHPGPPELLVSVRHPAEVAAALSGGAAVIDVKDPSRGPLGRADADVWQSIAQRVSGQAPLSLAWGELADWSPASPVPVVPSGTRFIKLGVAGLTLGEIAERWLVLRQRMNSPTAQVEPHTELRSTPAGPASPAPEWVLACYADHATARSPTPESLFPLAAGLGCRTVLVDTHDKQGPRLTELCPLEQLAGWISQTAHLGLKLALAGRLRMADARPLAGLGPAIVGIRSAACPGGDRQSGVDAGLVRSFAQALGQQAGGPESAPSVETGWRRAPLPGGCSG